MADYEVVIIGGGQAGLAVGHYLREKQIPFIILDSNSRAGDSWRKRYNSLVLFTPREYSSLPGLQMKGAPGEFPTKDELADYLETYVKHFNLPFRHNTNVLKLHNLADGTFHLETNQGNIHAKQVVIATGAFQKAFIPDVINKGADIYQVHSSEYRTPAEVPGDEILVAGGGNSGAQIATELAKQKNVTIAVGHKFKFLPLKFLGRSIFSWLDMTGLLYAGKDTIKGKWFQKQNDPIFGKELKKLIKHKEINVVPRVIQVRGKEVLFEDNTRREFSSIIWSTGFVPSYEWISIEGVITKNGKPIHERGITEINGLYFAGLPWQYQRGSSLICGAGMDAEYLVRAIVSNVNS